jgi:hypothetical protein
MTLEIVASEEVVAPFRFIANKKVRPIFKKSVGFP